MHKVTVQPSGQSFDVEEGEAVLTAALRQGVMLPYGCKNGACGSCKGKIVAGSVDYGHYHARVLTEEERAHGKALFCQAKPLGELVIECRTIGAAKDIAVKLLPCRVQQLTRAADDVMIVQLKLPANERLQFLPGQYIDFLLKGGERRSFSMANSPHADELVELHIRHVAGGNFTDHVFGKMKERDILRLEGPLGSFFLREDSAKPIVFVASGTGFAPIKSIIESAFYKKIERPMVLYRKVGARACQLPLRAGDFRGAAGRCLDRPQRLRAPRGDAGPARPVGPPGLCVRCSDHGGLGAQGLRREVPVARRRVLRRLVHHAGRSRFRRNQVASSPR
jgi:CDP-4-dehydro-6-deoxyglucose reductase